MNIALVDDMPSELSRLTGILNEYANNNRLRLDLKSFRNAEEFLSGYRPFQYTLIFMDIYMDRMTGVEAARVLRETDPDTLIVFLTTSTEHTFDAFDVHAYQYLLKSPEDEVLKSSVFKVLDEIVSLQADEERFTFLADGVEKSLPFSQIVFVQGQKNYLYITDRFQNTERIRMTFSQVQTVLGRDSRFLQINRGILINMDYITAFEKEVCELKGGHNLPVNVREHKKLDQIRKNYVFSRLHSRKK